MVRRTEGLDHPRAAGGAGEGEMGGERGGAASREADGSPFFRLVAPRERDRRDRFWRERTSEVRGRGACCTYCTLVVGPVLQAHT